MQQISADRDTLTGAANWYSALDEDARQLLVRPFGCISYGLADSFQRLNDAARNAVIRAHRNFGSFIASL
jgi:hypothetical protein